MAPIHYRIAGNAATIALQCTNGAVMLLALQDDVAMQDPQIRTMASMMMRFITVWNVHFQVIYAWLALVCDGLTLMGKEHLLPKFTNKIRNHLFTTLVFPCTMLIFTVFWPIYIYDRSLIYPEFIDKVFSHESGYVIHIAIVPSALWELAFQPREKPESHKTHVIVVTLHYLFYNAFVYYTYFERRIWPYELMAIVYNNTFYNIIYHTLMCSILLLMYFVQWPLISYFWGESTSLGKKKVK